jgi:5-methylcytosine-specific restriction protein B
MENGEPISDPEEFARRFRQEILPLLQEYCYDDYGTLGRYLGDKLVDVEGQTLREDILADVDGLLEALSGEFVKSPGAEG